MADLLALSWDRRKLSGIEVSPGASPRILGGFSVDWPDQPPTSVWLRETLRRHGINARQVALALPREDAVLRLLELPAVSDDELPTLVRFQAAARSAQSIDQLLLDYLPLPMREGVAQKEVWLATTLRTTVDPIRELLKEAGLDLVQLTLSSLCLTELITRGESKQSMDMAGASLVVLRDGARMELAVVCQRQLIAAHAVKWSSINDIPPVAKMLAEVSRVLVQVQAWLPEGTLQRAWVVGDDQDVGDLPDAISNRWKCPVQRFDPWRDAGISLAPAKLDGPSSDYAIVAGLALIQGGALSPKIDLLHPRQPPPKRDPRKPVIAAAAAAGLLVAALATGMVQRRLALYDVEINELRAKEMSLSSEIKAGSPDVAKAEAVKDWQARNINQLKQIGELHQVMNGTDKLLVSEYRFNPSVGPTLGKLTAKGMAKDRIHAEQLGQSLVDLGKYKVRPSEVTYAKYDTDFSYRFDLEMDIVGAPKQASPPVKPGSPASPANAGSTKEAK